MCGVGTGGTLTGVGRYLKEQRADVQVVLADPKGSTLSGGPDGDYAIEGIGSTSVVFGMLAMSSGLREMPVSRVVLLVLETHIEVDVPRPTE